MRNQPEVVCLCGPVRFKETYIEQTELLTRQGGIVLSVGMFLQQTEQNEDPKLKIQLDILHLRKIDLCDRIHVLNVGGYFGESTQREIEYAKSIGKRITFLED